jgi:enterochelin esterase-like enzyme
VSRFKTFEISDPQFESDHLRQITVKSPALNGRGDITVFVPPGAFLKNLPLVILLHGVNGSHWAWTHKGGAHKAALNLIQSGKIRPMILAMPSDGLWGDGSGYLPHHHLDFESWIMDDVPEAVYEGIPQSGKSAPLFIVGLSMGGYGALRLGAKYPKRFAAFAGHSSITALNQMRGFVEEMPGPGEDSVLELMLKNRASLPPFRFDCGLEDDLLSNNRALSQSLKSEKIPHFYGEFPGGHSWNYWQNHINDSLIFFDSNLK